MGCVLFSSISGFLLLIVKCFNKIRSILFAQIIASSWEFVKAYLNWPGTSVYLFHCIQQTDMTTLLKPDRTNLNLSTLPAAKQCEHWLWRMTLLNSLWAKKRVSINLRHWRSVSALRDLTN